LGSFNAVKSQAKQQPPTSQQPATATAATVAPTSVTAATVTATPTKQKTDVTTNTPTQSKSRNMGQESFGNLDSDPWGSPELHKDHNHAPQVNGISSHPTTQRTTSAFTTSGSERQNSTGHDQSKITSSYGGGGSSTGGWGTSNDSFRDSGLGGDTLSGGGGGFGNSSSGSGAGGDRNNPTGLGHTIGIHHGILSTTAPDEVITVTSIPEKEGMMFFQHRNYEVTSARRGSKVIRRYSDFVWLLDCLHKRYPYRQLPLLPPKRVAINGNHIAAESNFIEKRRRGLARFANALVRHHVLAQEQLIIMFLTVPTELAVWRKQATITVQDEFLGKTLPANLEDSLPQDLEDMFTRVRSGVRRSSEVYINLCSLVERLCKRSEGVAAEYMRIGNALASVTESSANTFAVDTNDVPLLNAGLNGTSKHMGNARALLVDEARAVDEGVLEDMKTVRDRLVSVRDIFDRRERLERDEIPRLEKRINLNEEKLKALRARPEGSLKPGEAEKVEDAILRVSF
jgi:sorting nexin-8